jgi:predicted phage-related endonuclease
MIQAYRYKSHADFQAGRLKFINASELGAVLGFSDYQSPLTVYLQKIGEHVSLFPGNRLTKAGQNEEARIAEDYRYWDHTVGTYENCLDNKLTGLKPLNKIRKGLYSYVNSKYTWLSCTPDYNLIRSSAGKSGLVEIKNTTTMATNKYKDGLDPSHYLQGQQQLLVTGKPYMELVQKVDGNDLRVFPFESHKESQEAIVEKTREFWIKVQTALAIKMQFGITTYYGLQFETLPEEIKEAVTMLQGLEPEMAGTDREFDFLKENIKVKEDLTIPGNEDIYALLKHHLVISNELDHVKKIQTKTKEEILVTFGEATRYEWDEKRYATYRPDARGARRLYISPKLEADLTSDL